VRKVVAARKGYRDRHGAKLAATELRRLSGEAGESTGGLQLRAVPDSGARGIRGVCVATEHSLLTEMESSAARSEWIAGIVG